MEPEFYREQLEAKEEMLAQTTRFLVNTQRQLEARNHDLQTVNRDIFDSIQFASIIQTSLLPDVAILKVYFKDADYRVIQQIGIGGDNVFIKNCNRGVLFGLFDSTGHGIPAALLSISGTVILKEMVYAMEIKDPRFLIQLLNQQLYQVFNSKCNRIAQKEGIIFHYFTKEHKLSYCSAKGKALHYRKHDASITVLESTKTPIGEDPKTEYRLFEIAVEPGDKLLIYSDGLQDQFGGENNRKFGSQRIKNLMELNASSSATNMVAEFERVFRDWKGDHFQTDDVSFIVIDF